MYALKKSESYLSNAKTKHGDHKICGYQKLAAIGLLFNTKEEAQAYLESLKWKEKSKKGWEAVDVGEFCIETEIKIENLAVEGYVIKKGDHVVDIRGGRAEFVYYKYLTKAFSTEEAANDVLKQLQKHGKYLDWQVVKFKKGETSVEENIAKTVSFSIIPSQPIHIVNNHAIPKGDVDSDLESIENILEGLDERRKQYEKELKEIEISLTDYYHYIEFSELDGVRGFKAYYVQKNLLRRRRELKDNLTKIDIMMGLKHHVNQTHISFLQMQERTYMPRFSNAMFINNDSGMKCVRDKYDKDAQLLSKLYDCFKENRSDEEILSLMKGGNINE